MSSTDIFPRKWSIRYSCDSSTAEWSVAFNSLADSRSWPNGFSTTTRAPFVGPAPREARDDGPEQRGWDLEVEDRPRLPLDRGGNARVRLRIGEVAPVVRELLSESREDHLVQLLAARDDRLARALHQRLDRPVVERDADDGTVQEPARLEAIERTVGHHARQIARDPEDHEHVGRVVDLLRHAADHPI